MKHMTPIELNELLKNLRKGKKVVCPECEKGTFEPIGDYKTTHGFRCNYCEAKIIIN